MKIHAGSRGAGSCPYCREALGAEGASGIATCRQCGEGRPRLPAARGAPAEARSRFEVCLETKQRRFFEYAWASGWLRRNPAARGD